MKSDLKPRRLTLVLATSLGLAALCPTPARADVLDWLNRRLDGLLAAPKDSSDINPDLDRYIKMLGTSGASAVPQPVEGPARSTTYQPRVSEMLREIVPDGATGSVALLHQHAHLLALLTARQGFQAPFRAVGTVGEGLEPALTLLARMATQLEQAPGRASAEILHQVVERAMAQVQSTHQLMVDAREVLESVRAGVGRMESTLDQALLADGRLQGLAVVLALNQTVRKGGENLSGALASLTGCASHVRAAFQALRAALGDLDELTGLHATGAVTAISMGDRPDRVRFQVEKYRAAHGSLREAQNVVRTHLALLRLNHQGLLGALSTLGQNPLVKGPPPTDLQLETVNPAFQEAVTIMAAHGRETLGRLSRLEKWAVLLREYRPAPLVIEELPDWVFTENSLPDQGRKWTDLSLLPEREREVDGLIRTLQQDFKVGPDPREKREIDAGRASLDRTLGDDLDEVMSDRPRRILSVRPSETATEPGSVPMDPALADLEMLGAPATAPTTSTGSSAYKLPDWY